MDEPIPALLCVDVEPDPRELDGLAAQPWVGFEKLVLATQGIRERLAAATGRPVQFTWFLRMDPQIAEVWGSPTWAAEAYERQLGELTGHSLDSLAVQHGWFPGRRRTRPLPCTG